MRKVGQSIRRLIPAHAGSTCRSTSPWAMRTAHPRSRGVDPGRPPVMPPYSGLSPLTRGRLCARQGAVVVVGLIPAHAGSTRQAGQTAAASSGSSPLTRGRRSPHRWGQQDAGLIPAHAGSTPAASVAARDLEAHPRSRGVDPAGILSSPSATGSSPLTRGRLRGPIFSPIPDRAHPRSRGVDHGTDRPAHWSGGSSPLTRGRRLAPSCPCAAVRLIPAHAGSTIVISRPMSEAPAHPRSRGVDMARYAVMGVKWGSSPLTRGRRGPGRRAPRSGGLIPAHAGSTIRRRCGWGW